MRLGSSLAQASLPRAAAEAGVVAFALVLPLAAVLRPVLGAPTEETAGPGTPWAALGIGLVYAGLFAAVEGAVRLVRAEGPVGLVLPREVGAGLAVVLAIWVGALIGHAVGGVVARGGFDAMAPRLAMASAVEAAIAYPLCRGLVLAWPAWNRLRRSRLLWALTHAQLVGALILAAGVAVYLAATIGPTRPTPTLGADDLPAGALAGLIAWVTTRFLPSLTDLLVIGAVASALIMPPAALVSFLVLRLTSRRLEGLVAATAALRAGRLATRVEVRGEDEVARLQADFNAMAANLEQTLVDLQAERNRVAGLLENRRQLAASVSHELRTPVATVRGYLEAALEGDAKAPAPLRADLETISREVERLQRLIDDLFALSRAEVGELSLRLEPVNAGATVCRLVETQAPLAWRHRRVRVLAEVSENVPLARADSGRLEQIVSNLLANAVRHTPPGGLVVVSVSAEPDRLRIAVRDTGEGIAPADLPHVFERFYRGSGGVSEGAGLGLALVKELAEAMGGTVEVASKPDEGSELSVYLPRA